MTNEALLDALMKRVSLLKQRRTAGDISVSQFQNTKEELEWLIEFVQNDTIVKSRTSTER